jgi:WD40 repeat protein
MLIHVDDVMKRNNSVLTVYLVGLLHVYDYVNGAWVKTHEWKGHRSSVLDVIWHPQGRHIISASLEGAVAFWDAINIGFLIYGIIACLLFTCT